MFGHVMYTLKKTGSFGTFFYSVLVLNHIPQDKLTHLEALSFVIELNKSFHRLNVMIVS